MPSDSIDSGAAERFIGRRMPQASDADRRVAHEYLDQLVKVLARIELRHEAEIELAKIRDSAGHGLELARDPSPLQ